MVMQKGIQAGGRRDFIKGMSLLLVDRKKRGSMRLYAGRDDSWKGLCDDENVDVVYICAPAGLHAEIPDFTRGAWKTAKPLSIGAVNLDEMRYDVKAAERDVAQMNV